MNDGLYAGGEQTEHRLAGYLDPMPPTLPLLGAVLAAYLLGSVPFGLLVAKTVAGVDVRTVGSGNVGATNVARAVGRKWFAVVFALDGGKGVVAVLVFAPFAASGDELAGAEVACALGAVLGHVFSLFLNFKGGKGVATTAGAVVALAPLAGAGILGVFLVCLLTLRWVSLASVLGALALVPLVFVTQDAVEIRGFSVAVALLVVIRHRGNLARIVKGTEPRVLTGGSRGTDDTDGQSRTEEAAHDGS